jgi:predicted outer membrane repeat protein
MNRSGKTVNPTILWFLVSIFLLVSLPAQAANFVVSNLADAGAGSLRQAILDANALAGADTITFSVSGTHSLNSALSITQDLTITGNGAGVTIIALSGMGADRVFNISSSLVGLSALTVQGGNVTGNGGGINITTSGNLFLSDAVVSGNTASGLGGGIYNDGIFYTVNTTVSGNTGTLGGGGIYNDANGYCSLDKSTISGNTAGGINRGGGLYNTDTGVVDLTNITVSNNTAGDSGGGIFNDSTDVSQGVSIYNATIAFNSAPVTLGAGIATQAGMSLTNTIVAMNGTGGDCLRMMNPLVNISGNYNLSSDGTCGFTASFDQQNTDPLLNPLAANGGPTQTHSLQTAPLPSPAINKGFTLNNLGVPPTDQRGVTRLVQFDLGAYETDTPPFIDLLIIKSGPPDPVMAGTPFDYVISVYNLTEGTTASAFTVLDTLPAKLVLVEPLPLGCTAFGQTLTCILTNLVGQAPPALITIRVNSLQGGLIENTAAVSGAQNDPDTSNNTWTELTAVSYPLPSITSLDPPSTLFGAPNLTLTVNGADFADVAVVRWNGTDLATTYQSPMLIKAVIPKALAAVANVAAVTVFNPPNGINAAGGGLSNTVNFFVNNPQPSISFITPNQTLSDGPGLTLTVTGGNFIDGAVVKLNGTPLVTSFVNGTRLTALVTPADTANPGVFPVVVENPAPAVAPSNTLTLTVIQGYYLYLPAVGR